VVVSSALNVGNSRQGSAQNNANPCCTILIPKVVLWSFYLDRRKRRDGTIIWGPSFGGGQGSVNIELRLGSGPEEVDHLGTEPSRRIVSLRPVAQ
jgi:hypothetical protein